MYTKLLMFVSVLATTAGARPADAALKVRDPSTFAIKGLTPDMAWQCYKQKYDAIWINYVGSRAVQTKFGNIHGDDLSIYGLIWDWGNNTGVAVANGCDASLAFIMPLSRGDPERVQNGTSWGPDPDWNPYMDIAYVAVDSNSNFCNVITIGQGDEKSPCKQTTVSALLAPGLAPSTPAVVAPGLASSTPAAN